MGQPRIPCPRRASLGLILSCSPGHLPTQTAPLPHAHPELGPCPARLLPSVPRPTASPAEEQAYTLELHPSLDRCSLTRVRTLEGSVVPWVGVSCRTPLLILSCKPRPMAGPACSWCGGRHTALLVAPGWRAPAGITLLEPGHPAHTQAKHREGWLWPPGRALCSPERASAWPRAASALPHPGPSHRRFGTSAEIAVTKQSARSRGPRRLLGLGLSTSASPTDCPDSLTSSHPHTLQANLGGASATCSHPGSSLGSPAWAGHLQLAQAQSSPLHPVLWPQKSRNAAAAPQQPESTAPTMLPRPRGKAWPGHLMFLRWSALPAWQPVQGAEAGPDSSSGGSI